MATNSEINFHHLFKLIMILVTSNHQAIYLTLALPNHVLDLLTINFAALIRNLSLILHLRLRETLIILTWFNTKLALIK